MRREVAAQRMMGYLLEGLPAPKSTGSSQVVPSPPRQESSAAYTDASARASTVCHSLGNVSPTDTLPRPDVPRAALAELSTQEEGRGGELWPGSAGSRQLSLRRCLPNKPGRGRGQGGAKGPGKKRNWRGRLWSERDGSRETRARR